MIFLRKLKLIHTLFRASFHEVFCNHFKCSLYLLVRVKVFAVSKAIKSLSAIVSFYLGEACLNRVELRRITDVLDLHDVQFFVAFDDLFCLMNTELIHEYSKPRVTVYLPQFL